MPRQEIDAVITSGPIVATYDAFHVRPLFLTEVGRAPRQLCASLVSVQVPPHPEVACAYTRNFDTSEEAVVRAVLDQLNEDYNVLTDFPYPWGNPCPRVVEGIGPRSDEDSAMRQAYSDRFVWMCEGLGTVADVVDRLEPEPPTDNYHPYWTIPTAAPADGEDVTSAIPEEEAILLATFGPFQVVRAVDRRIVLFPFPYALWHDPWKPEEVLTNVEVRFEAGEHVLQKLRTSLEEHDGPITRREVIAAWRGFIDSERTSAAAMTATLAAIHRVRKDTSSEQVPVSPQSRQRGEAIAKLIAAVEALEAEEARERAEHERVDEG